MQAIQTVGVNPQFADPFESGHFEKRMITEILFQDNKSKYNTDKNPLKYQHITKKEILTE